MTTMKLTTIPTPTPTWDESDVLRAAGVITDELSDYRPHHWRDLVDEVREFTHDGRWRSPTDLAYAALTDYLGDLRLVWVGEPGHRIVVLRPPAATVQTIPCPTCRVGVGQPCVRIKGNGIPSSVTKKWPHREREAAVIAAAEPAASG